MASEIAKALEALGPGPWFVLDGNATFCASLNRGDGTAIDLRDEATAHAMLAVLDYTRRVAPAIEALVETQAALDANPDARFEESEHREAARAVVDAAKGESK